MNFKEWLLITEKIMIKDQEFRNPILALQHIQKTHSNPENLVVTFTKIDKVGINPQSKHDNSGTATPLGIYLYPIDYLIKMKMDIPYAGNQPYFNVCEFTRPEKILHMTSDLNSQKGIELLSAFPKEDVDKAIQYIADYYYITSNYSELWFVTQILANQNPIQWNANLRKCGIDGFVDHGTKTIHPNEPTQCVVFTTNALKLLHSIENPIFEKTKDKYGVDSHNVKRNNFIIRKMEEEHIIRMLQSRRTLDIEKLLYDAEDKDKVAELIIKHKPELNDGDITYLFKYVTNKDELIETIMRMKTELSDDNVSAFLEFATDKEKIAEQLGTNNISKLSFPYVKSAIVYKKYGQQLAKIINKYHTKKTPEIQEIIDQTIEGKYEY